MLDILLIDDEPWALRGLYGSFNWAELGFHVVDMVTDPDRALQVIKDKHPDAVISDIRMPGMSGIDLLKMMREEGINSEIVFISGYAEFTYAKSALRYGAFDYLVKPIQVDETKNTLKRLRDYILEKLRKEELLARAEAEASSPTEDTFLEPDPGKIRSPHHINESFSRLLAYVDEHYCENLSLDMLSGMFHLNLTYICDLFRAVTGKTFSAYITNLRITKAEMLLRTTDLPIYTIAEMTGYSPYYFNVLFKKKFHVTPLQYRKGS